MEGLGFCSKKISKKSTATTKVASPLDHDADRGPSMLLIIQEDKEEGEELYCMGEGYREIELNSSDK